MVVYVILELTSGNSELYVYSFSKLVKFNVNDYHLILVEVKK